MAKATPPVTTVTTLTVCATLRLGHHAVHMHVAAIWMKDEKGSKRRTVQKYA